MIDNIKELSTIDKVYEKSIDYSSGNFNTSTGDKDYLYHKLKRSF